MSTPRKDEERQLELGADDTVIVLRKAWDRTLRAISAKVSKSTFENIFLTTHAIEIGEDGVVVIGAPSRFAREWLEKRYGDSLRAQLATNLGRPISHLRFVVSTADPTRTVLGEPVAPPAETVSGQLAPQAEQPCPAAQPIDRKRPERWVVPSTPQRPLPPELSMPLNPRFTFDNFIVGKCNRLAVAGALAVADHPGGAYNPLFLYGHPGLGKTHLMQAIGHRIRDCYPGARVAFISGEAFTNSYIAAVRDRKSDDFRAVYRNVDVWLVDDIQTIAGKEHTKEEFFHTFNTLHQLNKQIVISSDKSPRELRLMDERLRSRFECGLIADVSPPELEMRVAILQQKAEAEGLDISTDVIMYMANLVQSNIRTLEGALIKLMACASLSRSAVTKQLAREVLGSYFVERRQISLRSQVLDDEDDVIDATCNTEGGSGLKALPIPEPLANLSASSLGGDEAFEHIVQTVAAHFSIDPRLISGEGSAVTSRKRELSKPRQIAIYLTREKTSITVKELAHLFDVHHTAVSKAHGNMAGLLRTDPRTLGTVNEITSRL